MIGDSRRSGLYESRGTPAALRADFKPILDSKSTPSKPPANDSMHP